MIISIYLQSVIIHENLIIPGRRESKSAGEAEAAWCSAARRAPGAGLVKDREGTHAVAV